MKKIMVYIVLACLILAGCTTAPSNVETKPSAPNTPTVSDTPSIPDENVEPEYIQQPMLAVCVPAVNTYSMDDNGTMLFSHSYQNMRLVLQDPEVADKIILDFLERIDQTHEQADAIYQQALDNAASVTVPYSFSILYSPVRIDQSVLSLYGSKASYSGGVHPQYNCTAANYDMVTGDVLTLGSILANVDAIAPLYDLIIEKLDEVSASYQLIPGYSQIVEQRLFSAESYNEDWYFSTTGLCFFFPPYEIAPYSSGVITVEIPYESLTGIIGDGFFPPERDYTNGVVEAKRKSDVSMQQFTQIAEITIDEGGEMVFLYTDKIVYDVQVDVGYWDDSGMIFTPSYTAFAANSLTPGDAVVVETFIPDVMPNLRLTYRNATETVTTYIHQSGEDGSIYLINE